tara:strand:+ start:292 stop:675 length:384 start_codon:yes stop_codon:yes gene_type:complete
MLDPYIIDENKRVNGWGGRRFNLPTSLLVYNSLRMLAGGSYHDIQKVCGIHRKTVYRHLSLFIVALFKTDLGKIEFCPDDEEWVRERTSVFERKSPLGSTCIGLLDGLSVEILRPPNDMCPRDYRFV